MFKPLNDTNYLDIVYNVSNDIINTDRLRYKAVFDIIRIYCTKNNTIILSDKTRTINESKIEEMIELYTPKPRKETTVITNLLHKQKGIFVQMKSVIPSREYVIYYDMRELISIKYIDKYNKNDLSSLYNAVNISNILYFPSNVELIDVYHKLYSPEYYADLDIMHAYENKLYNNFKHTGGVDICNPCDIKKTEDMHTIKSIVLSLIESKQYTLIGKLAHALILNKKNPIVDNIQLISAYDITHDYANICGAISEYTKYNIFYKKKKLYIPKDTRICKYTFYIKVPSFSSNSICIDKPFLDIYNCGSYELIPYSIYKFNKLNLKIASPYVQMRFLCVDLWINNLTVKRGSVMMLDSTDRISYIYNTLAAIRPLTTDIRSLAPTIHQTYDYIGIYYNEKIEHRITISDRNIKKKSYYPEIYFSKNKLYKIIATS